MSLIVLFISLLVLHFPAGQWGKVNRDTVRLPADTTATMTSGKLADTSSGVEKAQELRTIPNKAFGSGEYLKFDINYGFVTAGEAVLEISDTAISGRKCLRVNFSLDSKPFFSVFYKVEDRYHTVIDADGIFPWHFEQHIREGGFRRDFTADFDQRLHLATTSEGQHKIPSYVQDLLSAFYFARTIDYTDFKPGQRIHLQNFYKDSTYELAVKFRGRQTIEVEAGTFNCVVIEPLAKEGGLFKGDGKVYVWITDDDRKMPVRVSSKIPIGSVESELVVYRGINGPINAKVNNE